MPLYDYLCKDCGPFRDWQSMSAAEGPIDCPTCGDPAPRAITAPFIANMNPHNRIAHQRNEKSADEPQVMSRDRMDRLGGKRSQEAGHSHHHHHGHGHHGHQHHSGRPWMIGH